MKVYAIVVPKDRWWVRAGVRLANVVMGALRMSFRSFVHAHAAIDREVAAEGLALSHQDSGVFWTVRLYRRLTPGTAALT